MREVTSLTREFDDSITEDNLLVPVSVEDAFQVPSRNWNGLISDYNSSHKKKFFLTPLECKSIVEHVKRGIPPQYMFKSLGYSKPRFHTLLNSAGELEERFEALFTKETLSDTEGEEFQSLMRHPLRILMMDVLRAEGVSDLLDWAAFNEKAAGNPEMLAMKMKAKFKDMFSERTPENTGISVQIKLGGDDDWVKDI